MQAFPLSFELTILQGFGAGAGAHRKVKKFLVLMRTGFFFALVLLLGAKPGARHGAHQGLG